MPRVNVCGEDEVPAEGGLAVEADDLFVALFRLPDGSIAALEDACPHAGAPLSDGFVEPGGCASDAADGGGGEADGGGAVVVCPLHAWRFDCKTGGWCDAPNGRVKVDVYPVTVEGGRVFVDVPG